MGQGVGVQSLPVDTVELSPLVRATDKGSFRLYRPHNKIILLLVTGI